MSALEKLMEGVLSISAVVTVWSGCAKMLEPMPEQMDTESTIVAIGDRLDAYHDMIDTLGDIVDAAVKMYGSDENTGDENTEKPVYTISCDPPEDYQDPEVQIDDIRNDGEDIPGNGDSGDDIVIGVKEGDIRDGHTGDGTGAEQVKFDKPIDSYIADGKMYEVDKNGNRIFEDNGNKSFPQGEMPEGWQSRTENYDQSKVDSYLDPNSENFNPSNYERSMAQCRCDAYSEIHDAPFYQMSKEEQQELLASDPDKAMDMRSTVWDSLSPEDRKEMKESNPQRAEALEKDFFDRLSERDGNYYGAFNYGYTAEELGLDDDRNYDDYDMLDSNLGRESVDDADPTDIPNRQFTPYQAKAELMASKTDVENNPYLSYDSEMRALEQVDERELKTGIIEPEKLYPGNDGFLADQKDGELHTGDIISRYSENGEPGSAGSFASRAEMGEDGKLHSPSYADRSMVNFEDSMEEHFYQVAPKQSIEQVDDDTPPPPDGSGEVLPSDQADSPDESSDKADQAESPDESTNDADQPESPDESTNDADQPESPDESTNDADQAESTEESSDEVAEARAFQDDFSDYSESSEDDKPETDQTDADDFSEYSEGESMEDNEANNTDSNDFADYSEEEGEAYHSETESADFSDYSERDSTGESDEDPDGSDDFTNYSEEDEGDIDTSMNDEYSETEDTFDNIETEDMDGGAEFETPATESVDTGSVDSGSGENVS